MYKLESESYFSHVREDIIHELANAPVMKVLEVGAGGCGTIVEIKKRGLAKHVTAIELFTIKNSLQTSPLIDVFLQLDLNTDMNKIPDQDYDIIIAADVLEHLINPWESIVELAKKLKPGGKLILSLPNLRNVRTLSKIIFGGSFQYADEGVLDKTHLRFFCRKDMRKMIEKSNLDVIKAQFSCDQRYSFFKIFPELFRELVSYQIIHVAQKR